MANTLSVLLVEDEALISMHLQSLLETAGYNVSLACCGEDALAHLNGPEPQPASLVTDVNLGRGPDGWDIARRARELHSQVQVVYMTGGAALEYCSRGVPQSIMIEKPFADAQLVTAISSQLNALSIPVTPAN